MCSFFKNLGRLKTFDSLTEDILLKRCLTTLDLSLLGIGSMVGLTLYVLTGVVAKNTAGPSVVLSYVIATLAATLAAMCYAEMGSIFPKTGSAYIFTYTTMGELPAFIAGWSLLLEYLLGAALVARGWSGYLDSILDYRIQNFTISVLMNGEPWASTNVTSSYPDLIAGIMLVVFTIVVAAGPNISANCNHFLLFVNFCVVSFVTVGGFVLADGNNWSKHGFFPYGVEGTISGAAIVFVGFIGYDVIAVSAEEAIDSHRSVPRATFISIAIVAFMYVVVALSLTLSVSYDEIDLNAVLSTPFVVHGMPWARYIVNVGALCSMCASMLGAVFSMPRLVYAMSLDGILFTSLSRINPTTHTPVIATVVTGTIAIILAVFINLNTLASMLSIGTLTAFTMVAASVMKVRYCPLPITRHIQQIEAETTTAPPPTKQTDTSDTSDTDEEDNISMTTADKAAFLRKEDRHYEDVIQGGELKPAFKFLTAMDNYKPGSVPIACFIVTTLLQFVSVFVVVVFVDNIRDGEWWVILLVIIFGCSAVFTFIPIAMHTQVQFKSSFKTPLMPFTATLSIFVNIVLLMLLPTTTWIQFAIWIAVGLVIYFMYGYSHSLARLGIKGVMVPNKYGLIGNGEADEGAAQLMMTSSLHTPQPPRSTREEYAN